MKINRQEVGFVYGCFYYLYMILVYLFAHLISGACMLLFAWLLAFGPQLLLKGIIILFLKPVFECLKFLYSCFV